MGSIGILKADLYLTEGMMLVNYPFLLQHFNLETVFSGNLEITTIIICQNPHNYLMSVHTEFFFAGET